MKKSDKNKFRSSVKEISSDFDGDFIDWMEICQKLAKGYNETEREFGRNTFKAERIKALNELEGKLSDAIKIMTGGSKFGISAIPVHEMKKSFHKLYFADDGRPEDFSGIDRAVDELKKIHEGIKEVKRNFAANEPANFGNMALHGVTDAVCRNMESRGFKVTAYNAGTLTSNGDDRALAWMHVGKITLAFVKKFR